MRIIGGAFRGRRLAGVGRGDEAARLRPTSDRVRESLFNVVQSRYADRLAGARVLDLFAGTGAMGLEALSRGAARADFVENGRAALSLLRRNIELCGTEASTRVLVRDARRLAAHDGPPFGLVFLDPPYGRAMGEAALEAALAGGWLAPDAMIVWEEGGEVTVPAGLRLLDERRYGDTTIRFLGRG